MGINIFYRSDGGIEKWYMSRYVNYFLILKKGNGGRSSCRVYLK